MMEDHRKFPLKTNDKYFIQKEVIQTKPSNPKSSQAANNLLLKSDQKHQKTVSLHKFNHSFINNHTKEVELSDESFSKSINKSSLGLGLNNQQFNQIINEKKKAFNEKIPKTYREISKSPENFNINSNVKAPISERNTTICKNCKEHEENFKKLAQILNNFVYEINSLNEIEGLWRNGNFSFENERIGSTSRNENCPPEISEDRELAETECGKLCQKLQHSLWKNRIKFEDLILDVENLSKMSPFLDIELKENKDLSNAKKATPTSPINPNEKLIESIKDARFSLEILKGAVLKGGISENFLREIKNMQKKAPNSNEIMQTLRLQLEQSLRERRSLMIELSVLRKQVEGQKGTVVDLNSLRKNIREIMESEIKNKKNMDASLSSSFNYNMI